MADKLEERLREIAGYTGIPISETHRRAIRLAADKLDEITRLNAENERARNDALAEAANIAEAIDSGRGNEREIAKAIRALFTKESRDSGHETRT